MAIPGGLKHRETIGFPGYYTCETLDKYHLARVREHMPRKETVKRVKKTVDLINKDDSLLSIAFYTYQIIRRCHPDRNQVMITYMEWRIGEEAWKREALRSLFVDYDPIWQVHLEQKSRDLVVAKFTFPGMEWLVYG